MYEYEDGPTGKGFKNMKKVYTKPTAQIETFEMSQYIASCIFNVQGKNTPEECYAVASDPLFSPSKVFMSGLCETSEESYCYGNMTGATPVFTS